MSVYDLEFDHIVVKALSEARSKTLKIYTFAFLYSHEEQSVSICLDDRLSSDATMKQMRQWAISQSKRDFDKGDLERAGSWQSHLAASRSLALGDFRLKNLAEIKIARPSNYKKLSLAMANAIRRNLSKILDQSEKPSDLIFCCSGKSYEVEHVWSALAMMEGTIEEAPPQKRSGFGLASLFNRT